MKVPEINLRFRGGTPDWAIDAIRANYAARRSRAMPDAWFWVDLLALASGYDYADLR